MEFFKGKFSKESESKVNPAQQSTEKGKVDEGRRSFLKGALGIAAGLALEKKAFANDAQEGKERETEKLKRLKESFRALNIRMDGVANALLPIPESEFSSEIEDANKGLLRRDKRDHLLVRTKTPKERQHYREAFLGQIESEIEIFLQELKKFINESKRRIPLKREEMEKDPVLAEALGFAYSLALNLESFGAQGLVYKNLEGIDFHSFPRVFAPGYNLVMGCRTADYLPNPAAVRTDEIDPYILEKDRKDIPDASIEASRWLQPDQQKKFRKTLEISAVRKLLQTEKDLSWSGACSLIKATIDYREKYAPHLSEVEILKKMLLERKKFSERVIVDNTTTIVRYHGYDLIGQKQNQFDSTKHDSLFKTIGPRQDLAYREEKSGSASHDFLEAIEGTRGKTLILADTHGSDRGWSAGDRDGIKVDDVADRLAGRVIGVLREAGPEAARSTLKEVTILAQPCHSFNFLYRNLIPALRKRWIEFQQKASELFSKEQREKTVAGLAEEGFKPEQVAWLQNVSKLRFEEFDLPTVIATSQENTTTRSGYLIDALSERTEMFQKTKQLRGEDFFVVESEIYLSMGGLTVSSYEKGHLYQISESELPHTSPQFIERDTVV